MKKILSLVLVFVMLVSLFPAAVYADDQVLDEQTLDETTVNEDPVEEPTAEEQPVEEPTADESPAEEPTEESTEESEESPEAPAEEPVAEETTEEDSAVNSEEEPAEDLAEEITPELTEATEVPSEDGATSLTSDGGTLSTGDYVLNSDIKLTNNIIIAENAIVTIDLKGNVIQSAGNGSSVITVKSGATLTLTDSNRNVTNYFKVGGNGRWNYTTDTTNAVALADLTTIPAEDKIIAVPGGAICGGVAGNGGGVMIEGNGTFNMQNGSIIGCHADSGGGVFVDCNGHFTMSGGAILGCDCDTNGNGGGLYNYSKYCAVSNATISYNIVKACGGGIYNNTTENGSVGEIQLTDTTISYNTAGKSGGGILSNGNTTVGEGSVVSNNTATENGGGIWVNQNTLWLLSGTVTGNTAGNLGGGVYYTNYAFWVGGAAKVCDNTATGTTQAANVYLASGKTISLYSPLTDGAEIHVYRADGATGVVVENAISYAKYFVSDQGNNITSYNSITRSSASSNNGEITDYNIEFSDTATPAFETGDGGRYIAAEQALAFSTAKEFKPNSTTETNGVKLLADFTNAAITVGANETLKIDLNGKKISGKGTTSSAPSNIFTVENGGKLILTSSSKTGEVINKGVIGGSEDPYCYGAAVAVNGGTLTMENCTIQYMNNTAADGNGGGISIVGSGAEATLNNCDILNCTARYGFGGGIYMSDGAQVTATDCKINANSSGKGGGAVAVLGTGKATFENTEFKSAEADLIQWYDRTGTSPQYSGHVIYAVGNSSNQASVTVSATSCSFTRYGGNAGGHQGVGDLRFEHANVTLKDSNITSSSKTTAAVYLAYSDFTMDGAAISTSSYCTNALVYAYVSNVKLVGAAQIPTAGKGGGNNVLNLSDRNSTITSNLTNGANIWLKYQSWFTTDKIGTATSETENQGAYYHLSDNTNYTVKQEGTILKAGTVAEVKGVGNYANLSYALAAADGKTVQLTDNIVVSESLTIAADNTITLDLNGHTITAQTATSPTITNNGTLTIIDSSTDKKGAVVNSSGVAIQNNSAGNLIIDNGNYTGTISNTGNLIINDGNHTGSINSTDGNVTLAGGTYSENPNSNYIDGGMAVKICGTSPYTYQLVPLDSATVLGFYYTESTPATVPDNRSYAFDSVHEAVAAMTSAIQESNASLCGYIYLTKNITETATITIVANQYIYLDLNGCTITGNGNDPVITNNGHLVLANGTIKGGTIGVDQKGKLGLVGAVKITDNTNNLYIREGGSFEAFGSNIMAMSSALMLTGNSSIGITTETKPKTESPYPLATGNANNDYSAYSGCFFSDSDSYMVIGSDKNLVLSVKETDKYLVRFLTGSWGEPVANQLVAAGNSATEPTATSISEFYFHFERWVKADGKPFNFTTAITADTALTAEWSICPVRGLIVDTYGADTYSTISLTSDIDDVRVAGLDDIAKEIVGANSTTDKSVDVYLSIKTETANTRNDSITSAGKAAGKDSFTYLNLSLTKAIGDDSTASNYDPTSAVEIIVPLDMTDKKDLVVYRVHDGTLDTFTESTDTNFGTDGTFYIEGTGANAAVHFFTSKFSGYEYAVACTEDNTAQSLTLEGTIGVNFYVDVDYYLGSNWKTQYPNAYVKLTYSDENQQSVTKQYTYSNWVQDSTTNMYKFTCTATPAQMNDDITIALYDGTDTSSTTPKYSETTTIAGWCESVIEKYGSNSEKAKFVALCKSLIDYGIAAQKAFSYNANNLTNDGTFYNLYSYSEGSLKTDLGTIPSFTKGENYSRTIKGLTFMVLADSSLRIYYNGDEMTATPTCTSNCSDIKTRLGATERNGTCIEVYGIPAKELDTEFTVTTSEGTLTACGLSYAKLVLNNTTYTNPTDSDEVNLVNLCKALILYNKAADAYDAYITSNNTRGES